MTIGSLWEKSVDDNDSYFANEDFEKQSVGLKLIGNYEEEGVKSQISLMKINKMNSVMSLNQGNQLQIPQSTHIVKQISTIVMQVNKSLFPEEDDEYEPSIFNDSLNPKFLDELNQEDDFVNRVKSFDHEEEKMLLLESFELDDQDDN